MASRRDRGAGSLYRRARDGRWVGEITLPDTDRRKSVTGATKREAQQRLAKLRREIEQYLVSWLESIKPTMSDGAWLRHEQFCRLQIVPAIGAVRLASLSAQHVQTLYASLLAGGLSSTTAHHAHATLHKALKAAVRLGLVARNVTEMVEVPRMRHHEMRVFSVAQARQFVAASKSERLGTLLILAITTGTRQSELLGIHWKDVQIDGAGDYSLSVRWHMRYRTGVFTFKILVHSSIAITLDIYSHVMPDMQEDATMTLAGMLRGNPRGKALPSRGDPIDALPAASDNSSDGSSDNSSDGS